VSKYKPAAERRKNKTKAKRKAYRARRRSRNNIPASNDGK